MESSHTLKTHAAAYLLFIAIAAFSTGWVMRGYADAMVLAQSISCGSPATLSITIPAKFGSSYVGVPYAQALQTSGGTACILPSTPTWTFANLPAGITGSTSTGVVTGTPTTAGPATPTPTVVVSDCGIGAQKQTTPAIPIPITVFAPKAPAGIVITSGVTTVAIPATSAAQTAQVTFSDGSVFSNPAIPIVWQLAGLSGVINTSTGAITAQNPGGNVSVTATFGGQSSPPETVSVTGGTPPSTPTIVTTSPLPNGFATIAYPTTTLVATGGTGGCCTWSPTGAIGASGLSLSSGGAITGSSPVAGTYSLNAVATDASSNASPAVGFAITINSVNSPVALSVLAGGGTAVSLSNNGTSQLAFSCIWNGGGIFTGCPTNTTLSSSAPSVATVSASGLVTAAASGSGTSSITASIPGCASCTSNIVTVTVAVSTVTFSSSTLPAGQQGISYSGGAPLACSGGTPPYTFAVNSGTLPMGLSLSSGGVVSGTVNLTATTQTLTFKCTDTVSNVGTSGSIPITIAVLSTVSITPLTPSIPQGGTQQFMLTGNYTAPVGTANVTSLVTAGSVGPLSAKVCNTGTSGGAGPITYSCTIPAADLVAVWVRAPAASDTFTVTDSASQTYTQPSCSPKNTNSNALGLFYKANTAAITTLTVNDTMAQTGITSEVWDISNGATSAPLDACPTGTTTASATSLTSPSLTYTNPNDILLYALGTFSQTSVTPTSPFAIVANAFLPNGRLTVSSEIVSAAATLTTALSWPGAGPANGIIAAFKGAASSTGWSSSNSANVSVNGSGLATGQNVSTGTTITGCVTMSLCASTTLAVTAVPDSGLVVLPNPASGTVNGTAVGFTAKGNNSGNPYSITVASSNQSIATTSAANASCIAPGTVTITASGGGLTGTAPLNCVNAGTGSLLHGCTVNASNVPSCSTPAGWTLVLADGLDGPSLAQPGNEYALVSAGTTPVFSSTHAETGSSLGPCNINFDGEQCGLGLISNTIGSSDHIYVSFWRYMDSNACNNTEIYFWDVYTGDRSLFFDVMDTQGTPGSCTTTRIAAQMLGDGNFPFNDGNNGHTGLYSLPLGTWEQVEGEFKGSTCTGSTPNNDGLYRLYVNGTLVVQNLNANLQGCGDSSVGMAIEAGGAFTYLLSSGSGSTTPGNGNFNVYVDDVIFLKQ